MRDTNFEQDVRTEFESPYCPLCGGCGEDGCCKATNCQGSGGSYCQTYLTDLKFIYDLFHESEVKYTDETFSKIWDRWYGKLNEKP